MKLVVGALLAGLMTTLAWAGEYADAFLLSSMHPQLQALGNSTVSRAMLSGYALNNPAGLTVIATPYFGLIYEDFAALSTNIGLEAAFPIHSNYSLGLTLIHSGVSGLYFRPNLSGLAPAARRDSVLNLTAGSDGTIAYREDAAFMSLAREFSFTLDLGWKFFKIPCRMPLGISTKYLDKLLATNRGLGFGVDLGGQLIFSLAGMSDLLVNTEWSLGILISDVLNTPVYWRTEHQDAIKRNYTIGWSISQHIKQYATHLTLSSSTQNRYPDQRQYGVEINVRNQLYVRAGYDGYTPSFGLGIGLKKFIIDYSFRQHELAEIQKIGINYHF